jgi:hypothetical protein
LPLTAKTLSGLEIRLMTPKKRGAYFNDLWCVGAAHALYIHDGYWYHQLERFPGALFDDNGYILFETEDEYRSSPFLSIGKEVSVRKPGISAIPGYIQVVASGEPKEPLPPSQINVGESALSDSVDVDVKNLLAFIVKEVNARAEFHRIGTLQKIRRVLKPKKRLPTQKIFSRLTTKDDYAFHHGGRTELQFNVGVETVDGATYVRHGVAFSLEPSQTLPSIDVLIPKVRRLNEFFQVHPDHFGDLRMWHYERDIRSADHMPTPIAPELVRLHIFICLGRVQPVDAVDIELILSDFDRLLPLYEFVEGTAAFPAIADASVNFNFRSGCSIKQRSIVVNRSVLPLDVQLRHNELQEVLYNLLAKYYGEENVGTEQPTKNGARVDVVLRRGHEYWFYEIKTALSARACIREALAQLLEYAYWPGAQEASRLIVIGEPPLDQEAEMYLERLRSRFVLPIDYQQLDREQGTLKGAPNLAARADF